MTTCGERRGLTDRHHSHSHGACTALRGQAGTLARWCSKQGAPPVTHTVTPVTPCSNEMDKLNALEEHIMETNGPEDERLEAIYERLEEVGRERDAEPDSPGWSDAEWGQGWARPSMWAPVGHQPCQHRARAVPMGQRL